MAQLPTLISLVVALLINTLSYCSAENVYCVTPNATSCSSCPHNTINCTTLSEYAREAELYFTSNTTMVFLPGDHALDTNITVANIAGLTMCGESSSGSRATVVCNGPVGLSFTSVAYLKIHSLAFKTCYRNYNVPLVSNYALLLQFLQYAELVNCSFHDNLGTALVVNNTNITLAGNSEFTHNHCESTSGSNSCTGGGGIYALSSNLTFTGNTTFLQNKAISAYGYAGGAICASHNTVISSLEPTTSPTTRHLMMVQSTHQRVLYLASMEAITSSATQQWVVVVQSIHLRIPNLASMEPTILSTTQHLMVELSTALRILDLVSTEPPILSTTRYTLVVVQFMPQATLYSASMEATSLPLT